MRPRPFTACAGSLLVGAGLCLVALAAIAPTSAWSQPAETSAEGEIKPVELPVRLLDRRAFDRITLDHANDDAVVETELLDFPDRKVPNPLPKEGTLKLRRLVDPSFSYEVAWSSVAKVELYEDMLLDEAKRLSAAGDYGQAFEYLAFLRRNYPEMPGLEELLQSHLWREAAAASAAEKYEDAWPVLLALYGRNPNYPELPEAVAAATSDLVSRAAKAGDYGTARRTLDVAEKTFTSFDLPAVSKWRARLSADAEAALTKARTALAAGMYSEARQAINHALAVIPDQPGARELWREIQAKAPEIRVGVYQVGRSPRPGQTPDWAASRVRRIADPVLLELVDFSAEGGVYHSPWLDVAAGASFSETILQPTPPGLARGVTAAGVALAVAELAGDLNQGHPCLAQTLKSVDLVGGRAVKLAWRRLPIRPEALLDAPLRRVVDRRGAGAPPWYDGDAPGPGEFRFRRAGGNRAEAGPALVVEQIYADDDAAAMALVRNDVDVLDRVPPWQVARLRKAPEVVVETYRLPTVHVLIPNLEKPLVAVRDFRRAICYGIDRTAIVRDVLLGGESARGFAPLSGPFPMGESLRDPVGYGYDNEVPVWPYEPRLATVLAGVARAGIAKREAELAKAAGGEKKTEKVEGDAAGSGVVADDATDAGAKPKEPPPLVIAHAADPVARLACQAIAEQLKQISVPVKLVETPAGEPGAYIDCDFRYAELAVWEPLVDARRLFGAQGVAPGPASPYLAETLTRLDRAENWNDARTQLKTIHRIVHNALPVIPLWQTTNSLAYHKRLAGVGERPVSLYQNVSEWKKTFEGE